MTIKEYRELESKINEEIKALKDKLVVAEKDVEFNIPFNIVLEELQKIIFCKNEDPTNHIKYNDFRIMIGSSVVYAFDKNIKGAIKSEIARNSEKIVSSYIECCDVQHRARAIFNVKFDMNTKLSDGTLFVDALKHGTNSIGHKILTMDEEDVKKVMIDMSPSGINYNEVRSDGFVDTLVERMEEKDVFYPVEKQPLAEIIENIKKKKNAISQDKIGGRLVETQPLSEIIEIASKDNAAKSECVKLNYSYSETEKTLEEHHYALSPEEIQKSVKKVKEDDDVM